MRYQGRIASWNSQRGFGFIKQEQGGADLFVHITTLQFDGRPPEVGEKVSYLIGSSKDGKPCAVQSVLSRPPALAGWRTYAIHAGSWEQGGFEPSGTTRHHI
jgi:cold shock CspA family protein